MKRQKQIKAKFIKYCEDNFDPIRAENEKKYLYSDLCHYGLSAKLIKDFVKSVKPELNKMTTNQTLDIVQNLWGNFDTSHEERLIALEILKLRKKSLLSKDFELLEHIMRQSQGWVYLDNLIIPIFPSLLDKYPQLYKELDKWIKDKNYWVRRSALLAHNLYFRNKQAIPNKNFKQFTKHADKLYDESWITDIYKDKMEIKRAKFFIRKAIGWNLREISNNHPDIVVDYLNKNYKKMSGLSYREASRKLSERYIALLIKN